VLAGAALLGCDNCRICDGLMALYSSTYRIVRKVRTGPCGPCGGQRLFKREQKARQKAALRRCQAIGNNTLADERVRHRTDFQ
jgi:hypothetical protein